MRPRQHHDSHILPLQKTSTNLIMDVDKPTFTINILLFSPNHNPNSKIVPLKLPLSYFTKAVGESEDAVKEKFSKWGLKSTRGRFEWWKVSTSYYLSYVEIFMSV